MNRYNKNIVVITLVIAVVFMGVGYSLIMQDIDVKGKTVINNSSFDIGFTSIESNLTSDALNLKEPQITKNSAYFDVELKEPGSQASYNITVENKGTIKARLETISMTQASSPFIYELYGIREDDIINAGEKKEITVIITWDENINKESVESSSNNFALTLDFVQK